MANVTEMPQVDSPEAQQSVVGAAIPTTSASKPEAKKTGRPKKGEEPDPEVRTREFFSKVASVPRDDWGSRAWMYVYIDEPACDEKQWGKLKYAKKLSLPIFDLEKIKDWYGSCKGWISLNRRKPEGDSETQHAPQIGRHEFEIFDILCPPKIPKACWTDDPVNKKWAALLPAEPKQQSEGATSLLDSIKVYKEIVSDVKGDMKPPEAATPTDQTKSTLETMKLAKELFAPPAAAPVAPPADPFTIAAKVMEMRANDPMVGMLMQRLDSMDKALAESRTREFQLQKEMLEKAAAPKAESKSVLDQIFELAGDDTKMDRIKKVAGMFGFGESGGGRAPRTTPLDVMREVVNSPFGAQLGHGVSNLLTNLVARAEAPQANGIGNQPQTLHPAPPNGNGVTHESDQAKIQRIANTITRVMIGEYFDREMEGGDFASWMFDGYPEDLEFIRKLGADTIVNLYRDHNAQLWQHITFPKDREADFRKFMQEVCSWTVPVDEDEETPEPKAASADGFEEEESHA